MAIVKQYTNTTYTSGIQVTEATPVDDRILIQSEEILLNVFTGDLTVEEQALISVLYDGLIIQVKDNRREYVWTESLYGLIPGGYTYPSYMNGIYEQDYGDKTYNLVVFDRINKIDITYSDINVDGLFIATSLLPFHVMRDMASANVVLKSSSSSFAEIEYPDRIEVLPTGLMVILDPKPNITEVFKITVS